jgi:glutamate N-acetyltransferase/amino-acid N-acetyltransferase
MKIHVPAGFLFSSAAAGIKASTRSDVAFAEAPEGANAAAVFTRNRVVAAPVEVDRDHLKRSRARVRAVIVNSGNANCATGAAGRHGCEEICKAIAKLLGARAEQVFPSSTGIIGVPLPAEKIISVLPQLIECKRGDEEAVRRFAEAIMTTDTRPKLASAVFEAGGAVVTVTGVAKGAGMIHPNLATMLVYIFSDIIASAPELRRVLAPSVDDSFNCISVDHDTSTNDTVLLLASGRSGVPFRQARKPFAQAVTFVCQSLAEQIVSDGEGVAHVLRLRVEGARNREEARTVARAIAGSLLVKTALAGCDPNWGRILAAAGYSGVRIDPAKVNIYIGPQQVCHAGAVCAFDVRAAHEYLTQPSYDMRVQLGRGKAAIDFLTTDLTADYVSVNAEYST